MSGVAFQISQPQLGYLVKSDRFFFLSYAAIFASMVVMIRANKWVQSGDPIRGNALTRKLRLPLLLTYGIGIAAVIAAG